MSLLQPREEQLQLVIQSLLQLLTKTPMVEPIHGVVVLVLVVVVTILVFVVVVGPNILKLAIQSLLVYNGLRRSNSGVCWVSYLLVPIRVLVPYTAKI